MSLSREQDDFDTGSSTDSTPRSPSTQSEGGGSPKLKRSMSRLRKERRLRARRKKEELARQEEERLEREKQEQLELLRERKKKEKEMKRELARKRREEELRTFEHLREFESQVPLYWEVACCMQGEVEEILPEERQRRKEEEDQRERLRHQIEREEQERQRRIFEAELEKEMQKHAEAKPPTLGHEEMSLLKKGTVSAGHTPRSAAAKRRERRKRARAMQRSSSSSNLKKSPVSAKTMPRANLAQLRGVEWMTKSDSMMAIPVMKANLASLNVQSVGREGAATSSPSKREDTPEERERLEKAREELRRMKNRERRLRKKMSISGDSMKAVRISPESSVHADPEPTGGENVSDTAEMHAEQGEKKEKHTEPSEYGTDASMVKRKEERTNDEAAVDIKLETAAESSEATGEVEDRAIDTEQPSVDQPATADETAQESPRDRTVSVRRSIWCSIPLTESCWCR